MNYRNLRIGLGLIAAMSCPVLPGLAQQASTGGTSTSTGSPAVPQLVNYSGVLTDLNGKPLTGLTGVTLSLYKDSEGGVPLWMEVQNIQPDKTGHFTLTLGATTNEGLPTSLFAAGEARWLGVRAEGQAEQPRVLLLSVPYALKAADAETVGGLPPSAFMLAAPAVTTNVTSISSTTAAVVTESAPPAGSVTGTGTANFVPLWTSTSNIGNSVVSQSGSGSTAKIGINTSTPASTLDVKGGGTIRGLLSLPATGTATATAGKNSQPLSLAASSFSSTTSKAVTETFQWQAEPTGNNSATPAGTLNLLFGSGSSKAAETGLNIASNGQITFAPGQAFPGTGNGTITGLTAGTDLTGGGTSGNVTLNLDTTKVPQLATSNTFAADQSITGNLTATGLITGMTFSGLNGIFSGESSFSSGALVKVSDSGAYGGIVATSVAGNGVVGVTTYETGVWGQSSAYVGVIGQTFGNYEGVLGEAITVSGGIGVYGKSDYGGQGVWGESVSNNFFNGAGPDGVHGVANGSSGSGVAGINTASGGTGVYGAVYDSSSDAGHFDGNVFVNGNLSKNGGSFKIDHPLDPANQYLYHSFVESPDMKNIYDGVIALDASGEAVITLPEWFGALNRDFRYQLTCVGGFAQVYVAEEVANNQFKIAGGRAGLKVSWQVTGIRQDAWANAHRIPVEEPKSEEERGTYLHPELFGAPKEAGLSWRRYHYPDNVQPHKALVPPAHANRGLVRPRPTAALASH